MVIDKNDKILIPIQFDDVKLNDILSFKGQEFFVKEKAKDYFIIQKKDLPRFEEHKIDREMFEAGDFKKVIYKTNQD